jgi:hypothetical protein
MGGTIAWFGGGLCEVGHTFTRRHVTDFGRSADLARRYWAVEVESVDDAELLGVVLVLALPCPEGDGSELKIWD